MALRIDSAPPRFLTPGPSRAALVDALDVHVGDVVAFVGAGGKTTSMFRLADELTEQGGRVLVTTTTKIYPPGPDQRATLVLADRPRWLVSRARAALRQCAVVVAGRQVNLDGKVQGIPPAWLDELKEQCGATHILVEADGSAGRPFKAPASHEPVIPPSATLVVAVAGLSVIGKALDTAYVHRPERVAEISGSVLGAPVLPGTIARVMRHPDGSARGAPAEARIVYLLNQADSAAGIQLGYLVGMELLSLGAGRVVIAAAKEEPPVRAIGIGPNRRAAGQPDPDS